MLCLHSASELLVLRLQAVDCCVGLLQLGIHCRRRPARRDRRPSARDDGRVEPFESLSHDGSVVLGDDVCPALLAELRTSPFGPQQLLHHVRERLRVGADDGEVGMPSTNLLANPRHHDLAERHRLERADTGVPAEQLVDDDVRGRDAGESLFVRYALDEVEVELEAAAPKLIESREDELRALRRTPGRRVHHERPSARHRTGHGEPGDLDCLRHVDGLGHVRLVQDAADGQQVGVRPDDGEPGGDLLLVAWNVGVVVVTPFVVGHVVALEPNVGAVEREHDARAARSPHGQVPEPGKQASRRHQRLREVEVDDVELPAERFDESGEIDIRPVGGVDRPVDGEAIGRRAVLPDLDLVAPSSQPLRHRPGLVRDVVWRVQDPHAP